MLFRSEIDKYKKADEMIKRAEIYKIQSIKNLLVKGYSFGEIAKFISKNSRQSVYQFYRSHKK